MIFTNENGEVCPAGWAKGDEGMKADTAGVADYLAKHEGIYNMPKINKYVDIDQVEREAKKDLIDRHSPFIHCANTAVEGEPFEVTVKMGNEYTHPDDFDHFIESVSLF
jgi:hypothetical protein